MLKAENVWKEILRAAGSAAGEEDAMRLLVRTLDENLPTRNIEDAVTRMEKYLSANKEQTSSQAAVQAVLWFKEIYGLGCTAALSLLEKKYEHNLKPEAWNPIECDPDECKRCGSWDVHAHITYVTTPPTLQCSCIRCGFFHEENI